MVRLGKTLSGPSAAAKCTKLLGVGGGAWGSNNRSLGNYHTFWLA